MSYLNAGISKLTEQIYVALDDARQARRLTRRIVQTHAGDSAQVKSAVRAEIHTASFAQGMVKAWEIVTGEIWGEAMWQSKSSRP